MLYVKGRYSSFQLINTVSDDDDDVRVLPEILYGLGLFVGNDKEGG